VKIDRVANFLDDLRLVSEERHDLISRLRKIILDTDKQISEEIKYGGIMFSAESPFCGLFSYTHHVSLEFGRGAEIPDPHKVLEGSGQKRRHIKLTGQADIFKKNIREYVLLAMAHTRATRDAQRAAKKKVS
jgi:hypothetical protein